MARKNAPRDFDNAHEYRQAKKAEKKQAQQRQQNRQQKRNWE